MAQRAALLILAMILLASAPATPLMQAQRTPATGQKQPPAATAKPAPTQDTIGPLSHIRPAPDTYRFPNGQTLHYSAEWRLWSAGTASLKIEANGTEQHVSGSADAIGVVALLYRVADRFDSYFDRKSLCSSHISKHTEEGRHLRDTSIRFDYARKMAVLDERNLKTGEKKHTEESIPGCVSDVISAIYYVGSLPLEPGTTHTFPLNDGGKTVDVKAHVEAREEIKTEAGTFRTVRVQPEGDTGVLKSRGKIWVWYTDDSLHIPVQMRARLFWGTLTFQLTRIERQ